MVITSSPDVEFAIDSSRENPPSVSGSVTAIREAAGSDIQKLMALYGDAEHCISGNIQTELADILKKKLVELANTLTGESRLSHGQINALLALEEDPVNSDQCVTNVLNAACRNFDTAMHLWERFTSGHRGRDVDPRSDRFLRKHLETYGGDKEKLKELAGKFNSGSRRAASIYAYVKELCRPKQMPGLQAAQGDYDALVRFKESVAGEYFVLNEEFYAAINEILPAMIETCEGNFDKLVELYEKPYCSSPRVQEAIQHALSLALERCEGDLDALAELLDKTPHNFHDVIKKAVSALCKSDRKKVVQLARSPLAKLLPQMVILNLEVVEEEAIVDIDLFKSLVNLKKTLPQWESFDHQRSLLKAGVKRLVAQFIKAHKTDVTQLVLLAETVKKIDEYPEINEALKEALVYEVGQCGGNVARLIEIYEQMPQSEAVAKAVKSALADCSPETFLAQVNHDFSQLATLCKKMPHDLADTASPLIREAVKKMAQSQIAQCKDDFEKLGKLYDGAPYDYDMKDAVKEAAVVCIKNALPNLITQCDDDLQKLGALYDKIPWRFQKEAGGAIVDIVASTAKSLAAQHMDDLDALVAVYDNIPLGLRAMAVKGDEELCEQVRKLLVSAIEKCGNDIDALKELKRKMLCVFDGAFEQAVGIALPSIVAKCRGDFGKLAELYSMVPPECQSVMQSSIQVENFSS